MAEYKVQNKVCFSNPNDIKIKGFTGEIMNKLFYERVFSDSFKQTAYKEAKDAFTEQVDDDTAVGYWRGEFSFGNKL